MKQITIYEANDGKRFDNKNQCADYEKIIERIENIFSGLTEPRQLPSPSATRHDAEKVKNALAGFMDFCIERFPSWKWMFNGIMSVDSKDAIKTAYKFFSDYANDFPVLYRAFRRLYSTNIETGVEYCSQYYLENESEFDGVYLDENGNQIA